MRPVRLWAGSIEASGSIIAEPKLETPDMTTELNSVFFDLHEFAHFLVADVADCMQLNFGLNEKSLEAQLLLEARAGIAGAAIANDFHCPHLAAVTKTILRRFVEVKLATAPTDSISAKMRREIHEVECKRTHWGHKEFVVKRTKERVGGVAR